MQSPRFCAGPVAAKTRVRPILDAIGAAGVFDFGEEDGAGTTVKLVGNFLIGPRRDRWPKAWLLRRPTAVTPRRSLRC